MHDPHDDLLEQELSRLSEYTGEAPSTPLWQQAIDNHRREQQQRVWVWVRRPAPALAAAGLAVLVASVALRPVGQHGVGVIPERSLSAKSELTEGGDGDVKPLGSIASLPGGAREYNDLTDLASPSMSGLDKNDTRYAGNNHAGNAGNTVRLETTGRADERASRLQASTGPGSTGSGGAIDPSAAFGGGVSKADTRKTEEATRGIDIARTVAPAPSIPAPDATGASPSDGASFDRGVGVLGEIPEPSANLSLSVQDVGSFYKYVPTLVNQKLGEEVLTQPQSGAESKSNSAQGVNLTLRVQEDRLGEVLGELKKYGRVQGESGQQLAKETRLMQIDALVENQRQVAEKAESASKEKNTKDADAAAIAVQLKEAEGTIDALNRRRSQIEKGGELATINIVAVPAEQSPPLSPPPPAPLAVAPPTSTVAAPPPPPPAAPAPADPALADAHKRGGGRAPSPSPGAAGPVPTAEARPAAGAARDVPSKRDAERLVVPGLEKAKATPESDRDGAPGRAEMHDLKGNKQSPPPGAVPVAPAAPTNSSATPAVPPATPAAPAAVEPAPAVVDSPSTGVPTPPGQPGRAKDGALGRAEEGGKLKQAAREGLSSLGDSTASVVKNGIATMLYWVPALVVVVGGAWWWKRRAASAAQEPPPQ